MHQRWMISVVLRCNACGKMTTLKLASTTPGWLVGLKRSIGASLDFACIGLLVLSPWFFNSVTGKLKPESLVDFVRTDMVIFLGFCLAMSPLSLIYWRIVFHKIMRSPTPGEMFSGLISSTKSNGLQGVMQEAIYGLAQYFALWITGGPTILMVTILMSMGAETSLFIQHNFLWLAAVAIGSLSLMATVYWPRSNTDYQSLIDDECGVIAQRLR